MKHRQEEYWKPRFHAPPLQSHPDPPPTIQCSWYPHEGQCPYMRLAFICWRGNGECTFTDKVEIRRNKDNALIADAFELAAGKSISTLTLLEAPEFGNVDCTVTITAYRDGKQIGTLNTELTLHTAYLWPKEVQ